MAEKICKAGNKSGVKCDYKRNQGEGVVTCAAGQDCIYQATGLEHLKAIKDKLKLDDVEIVEK